MIRLARIEEVDAVSDLVERAYASWVLAIGRRPAPMDDDYAHHIAAGEVFVLERDGAIAAVAVLIAAADHLLLDNVAVDPGWQHAGLGRQLIAFAEAEARRRNLREVRLFTNVRMERNIALYERLGFRETHRAQVGDHHRAFMTKIVEP